MTRFRRVLALPLALPLAVALVVAPAAAAHAKGSVPAEVAAYVADGSLRAELDDVYGLNAAGDGIDFDDTTTMGAIQRVHVWSDDLRAGRETEHPVELVNEWVVAVSIAEEPVGVATIWINPATVRPELGSFETDVQFATALAEVPEGAALVRDAPSAAWLALDPEGTLFPLVPGRTGLSTPVPLEDVALLPLEESTVPPGDPGTGLALAAGVLLVLFAIIVVALVLPVARGRKKDSPAEEPLALEAPATD